VLISDEAATQTDIETCEAATQIETCKAATQADSGLQDEAATQTDIETCEAATQIETCKAATQADSSLQDSCPYKVDAGAIREGIGGSAMKKDNMSEKLKADLPDLSALIKELLEKITYMECSIQSIEVGRELLAWGKFFRHFFSLPPGDNPIAVNKYYNYYQEIPPSPPLSATSTRSLPLPISEPPDARKSTRRRSPARLRDSLELVELTQ
jgi:hypothetical protein